MGFYNADGKSSKARDVFRAMAFADSASILIKIPVKNVMATVFDGPMAPVGGEYFLGIGLIRRSAVNAIGYFTGDFAGFIADGFSFDGEGLADMGEVQIIVQFGCNPDFSSFDAAVVA